MTGLARGAAVTLTARGAALVLGVLNSVIIARALGPAGKGEYALIVLIPALLQFAGAFGLDQATTWLVARRREEARSLGATLAAVTGLLGLGLVAAYAVITRIPPYQDYLAGSGVDPGLVWILVGLLPVTLAAGTLNAAILALERYRVFNLISLIQPTATLALLVLLVLALGLGVGGAVAATGAATGAGLIGAGAAFLSVAPGGRTGWRFGAVREALGYGGRVHAGNIAWFLHYRADMFLLGYLAGPAALGFYSVAVGLAEKLYMAPSAVGTVLLPRISAEGDEDARVTPRASRYTLWLTLAAGLALAAVGRPAIRLLYGTDFLPSVAPLWILLPGVVSLALGRVISADLNGRGMPGTVARANAGMAVVNVALNLWWIPIWGAAGAAAATSVSYTAASLLLSARYRRVADVAWTDLVRLDADDRAAIGAALARLMGRGKQEPSR